MSAKNLREALAFGCGVSTDSPYLDHLEAVVKDYLRNKLCPLTASSIESVSLAGEHLARELDLYQNVTKPEVSLPRGGV